MAEQDEHLDKIEKLVNSADRFNEMSFRLVLEGLVNKGGEEAEMFLVRYVIARDIPLPTRLNIIRVVGYLQSQHFLIPLKKIIDTEDHIQLKKEAVISVSKYNDRRALNILNNALANIKNPLLLETINNEIGKIKRNNPIFALLPRFLDGDKNPKNLAVTIGILKRILTPKDAGTFVNYLHAGKRAIENGAFEILCHTCDVKQKEVNFKFFQERFDELPCTNQEHCQDLYELTKHYKRYFDRFPQLIDEQVDNLGTQLYYVRDSRIQGLLIAVLCKCGQEPTVAFVQKVYTDIPTLRETIIREYAGNDAAMDFLFEKYNSEPEPKLKEPLIQSLLATPSGCRFFLENFKSLDEKERENVIQHLPYDGVSDISGFFHMVFDSDEFLLKELLLKKLKTSYDFSVKFLLFDPTREQEFTSMEDEYLDTVAALFPVSAVKRFFEEIVFNDFSTNKLKKYLRKIVELTKASLSFEWKEKQFVTMLFNKILAQRVPDLNVLLLEALRNVKTFDADTHFNVNENLGMFVYHRDKKISETENAELRRVRKNFQDIQFEIQRSTNELKTLDRLFSAVDLEFESVNQFFTNHSLSVALNIDRACQAIEERLLNAGPEETRRWLAFFNEFDLLAFRLKDAILKKAESDKTDLNLALLKFHQALPDAPPAKVVIRLYNKQVTAILRDQCMELIPDVTVDTKTEELGEEDILICDAESLKTFILKNTIPSHKLFLFLEDVTEFESFKSYNPRPLMKPFSAYRFMREILRELYI